MRKRFKGSQTAWNNFLKPAVNTLARVIGMALGGKSRITKVGQATTNILKSLTGGKILSLTVMDGRGLRLKVIRNHFKANNYNKMDNTNDLMKRFSRCGIISLKSNFHENKTKNDGLSQHCKLCRKFYRKKIIMNITI